MGKNTSQRVRIIFKLFNFQMNGTENNYEWRGRMTAMNLSSKESFYGGHLCSGHHHKEQTGAGGFNNREVSLIVPEAGTPRSRGPQVWFLLSPVSLVHTHTAAISPCPHMAFPLCAPIPDVSLFV